MTRRSGAEHPVRHWVLPSWTPATGPGGHGGAATGSSAAGSNPSTGSSEKSLPGPATNDPTPALAGTPVRSPWQLAVCEPIQNRDARLTGWRVAGGAARTGRCSLTHAGRSLAPPLCLLVSRIRTHGSPNCATAPPCRISPTGPGSMTGCTVATWTPGPSATDRMPARPEPERARTHHTAPTRHRTYGDPRGHDTRRFERPAAEATRPGPSPIVGCDDGPPLGGLLFPLFRYWLLKGPWITLAPRGMAFDHRHGGISRSSVCLLASGGRG